MKNVSKKRKAIKVDKTKDRAIKKIAEVLAMKDLCKSQMKELNSQLENYLLMIGINKKELTESMVLTNGSESIALKVSETVILDQDQLNLFLVNKGIEQGVKQFKTKVRKSVEVINA
jgi:hypothetical protein|tara:strand:- start:141 stop:491 length:351 start_codon:yes stop_codon:yes gene_type:complete